jgi:hypothetical protein
MQPEDALLGWEIGWAPRSLSPSRSADPAWRNEAVLSEGFTGQSAEEEIAEEDCTGFDRYVGTGSGSGEEHPKEPKPGFKARSSATYGRKDLLPHERDAFAFLQRAWVGDQKEGGAATLGRSPGFEKTLLVSASFVSHVVLTTLMPGLESKPSNASKDLPLNLPRGRLASCYEVLGSSW